MSVKATNTYFKIKKMTDLLDSRSCHHFSSPSPKGKDLHLYFDYKHKGVSSRKIKAYKILLILIDNGYITIKLCTCS